MVRNEEEFYQDLKNIFIGAKVEGNSGFVNLMKIKSTYFEKILKYSIANTVSDYPISLGSGDTLMPLVPMYRKVLQCRLLIYKGEVYFHLNLKGLRNLSRY